ncbi:ricin-type beta-trefoil lectin domain protein [Streptomyces chrestomyceticus]|uniref:RICIN domain-containing protein n=1 Tax=Streptomyces chrestomyceticus TaxID=68185 RepID=UPI00368A589E
MLNRRAAAAARRSIQVSVRVWGGGEVGGPVFLGQLLGGEQAQEVEEAVAVGGGVGLEKAGVGEVPGRAGGAVRGQAGKESEGLGSGVGPRGEGGAAEDGAGVLVELPVGEGERGPHLQGTGPQAVQAALVGGEFGDEFGDGLFRAGGEALGGDADGQRQVSAQFREVPGGLFLAPDPLGSDDAGEQFDGFLVAQQREFDAVDGFEAAQGVAAGDQGRAGPWPGSRGRSSAGYTYTKTCGRDNSYQHWYRYDSNGAIQLQNRVSGKCLTATSTETVYAKNCDNGDSAQWWTEEYVSGGVVMLISQRNRMALDSDARGNAYLKSPGAGNTYQEWKVLQ